MPVILATQEAAIRRIVVQRQIVHKTLSQKKTLHKKKRADGVAQRIGPEFKPQYCKERKKEPPEGTLVLSSAILPIYRVLILTS
jgi:hypothetical protein